MKVQSKTLWFGTALTSLLFLASPTTTVAQQVNCSNPVELTLQADTKIKFCEIPGGQSPIGSNLRMNEQPVILRSFNTFHMGQFEVTQAQYRAVMNQEPWKNPNGQIKRNVRAKGQFPAVYVSYYDAREFARALSQLDPRAHYRLPTEAEWEYAARGGTSTNYHWGDQFDADQAYYWENTKDRSKQAQAVNSCPSEALSSFSPGYCANPFGLFHMSGNVWEWTLDAYEPSYGNASLDGHQATQGGFHSQQVIRGGSWGMIDTRFLRPTYRTSIHPSERNSSQGFRLVRIAY